MEEQIKTAPQTDVEVVDIQFRSCLLYTSDAADD